MRTDGDASEEDVWNQLRQCYDPEIPVNIVDLGLVYDCRLIKKEDGGTRVEVKMTLTAPGCGMGPAIAHDAQSKILSIDGIDEADVAARLGPAVEPEHDQRSRPDEARHDLSSCRACVLECDAAALSER